MKNASDFSHIKSEGYGNINEFLHVTDKLHCGETLYGDPNAKILLLAQDPANYEKIKSLSLKKENKNDAYGHDPKAPTNKNLVYIFDNIWLGAKYIMEPKNRNCGIYYANAIWLLKYGSNLSSSLGNVTATLDACKPIFKETISGLRNLKLIISLGHVAYNYLFDYDHTLDRNWKSVALNNDIQTSTLMGRKIEIGAIYHPGNRGTTARKMANDLSKNSKLSGRDLLLYDVKAILDKSALFKE